MAAKTAAGAKQNARHGCLLLEDAAQTEPNEDCTRLARAMPRTDPRPCATGIFSGVFEQAVGSDWVTDLLEATCCRKHRKLHRGHEHRGVLASETTERETGRLNLNRDE